MALIALSRLRLGHLALAVACGVAAACGGPAVPGPPRLADQSRVSMGSSLQLSAWTTDEAAAEAAFGEVFAEFDRLESLLSVWRPGSDVIRLNNAAGEAPVPISGDTRAVLLAARQASEWTQGKFDITFGALADIWKFDHDQDNRIPSTEEIRARLPLVDYQQVVVDEPPGTAFIRRRGMRVHLGGIGKGYAIDRAVALLRQRGFADFMIQAGGDLYVAGLNNGQPWKLGIRDPRGPADRVFATVEMGDGTFSTSGDYERFFLRNGRRYHHLLDPDLGDPARLARSVTIVSNSALLADALSTGVFILGPVEGMALVERLPDVEAVMVTADNAVVISSGLAGQIQITTAPTDAP